MVKEARVSKSNNDTSILTHFNNAASESLTRHTLDVIIKSAIFVPVLFQKAESIMVTKVFKLNQACGTVPENNASGLYISLLSTIGNDFHLTNNISSIQIRIISKYSSITDKF